MHPGARLAVFLLALGVSQSSGTLPIHWTQDAYVWQRQWTPALDSALKKSASLIAGWRVLGAETDARGTLEPIAVDWTALRATGRPTIAVVRIDGALAHFDEASLLAQIGSLAADWRQRSTLAGIEIDYDCATSKLPAYADFLKRLHAQPEIPRHLSVTALPTWLGSSHLPEIVAATDEIILQVHAIRAPTHALFDASEALDWIDAFDRTTNKPFRVALPDYAVRATWSEDGTLVAVEGEVPKLAGGTRARELVAMPQDAERLLADLDRSPPQHLAGLVWFRLPTSDDALAWSLETWWAVLRGDKLRPAIEIEGRTAAAAGLLNVILSNSGEIDAELPRRIGLPSGCTTADAVNGYALENHAGEISFARLQSALLPAHHQRTIGWMRCGRVRGAFDVRP